MARPSRTEGVSWLSLRPSLTQSDEKHAARHKRRRVVEYFVVGPLFAFCGVQAQARRSASPIPTPPTRIQAALWRSIDQS